MIIRVFLILFIIEVVLEVGCGHGDYTVNLAKHFPDKNFIGLDLRPARLWVGAKLSLDEEISNAAFLATRAERLPEILKEEKISEIYIPFPEPHVRRRCEKRRLVSDFFLNIYKQVMVENGIIIFKTDDDGLYEYSVKVLSEMEATIIENDPDLYSYGRVTREAKQIQTTYEKYYIEKTNEQ